MLQTVKKYALCFAELLLHICLVIFYFFRFLFKGRPELKDPATKLCIDNKPHCCLHPTAGTASFSNEPTANGTAGVKSSSYTDKMARESTTKSWTTPTLSRKNTYWESIKSNLRSGYQRIASGCQRVKRGCAGLKSKLGSAFSWIASYFKRSTSTANMNASSTSAVPWRRVSYSDSAAPLTASNSSVQSSAIPCPPPPPPSSIHNDRSWSNKGNFATVSWVNNDYQSKLADSAKGKIVGGTTVTTATTNPIGTTKTVRKTEPSDVHHAAVADNIATAEKLSQSDQYNQDSSHETSSKLAGNSELAIVTKQPKAPSFTESAFLISSSTPSTPASPSYAFKSIVPEPEIQFPVYANRQPQQQRSTPAEEYNEYNTSGRFKSPEPYKRRDSASSGRRRSSGSYLEHSASSTGADSQALLMGRSVYTPVFEAEQMRPIINRRSSATPAPSDSRSASRTSHTSRSYARSRTVEPRPYERTTAAAEHQKYLANAQFEISRARDDSVTPVRAASRQWPPPSNATGPEIVKDLWMANSVSLMEPMELDSMTDPRALAQSWHAEAMTTAGLPVISNHYVSSSRGAYRESVYDQVRKCQTIARSLTSPPPSVNSRGRRIFEHRKDRVARFRRAQGHSPDPTDAASESDWMTSGETDDEGAFIHRAVRNPQGDVRDYHKLSKEYEVVMSNPERSVQLSSMLRGETGKGVDMFSKLREKTDKYAVEQQSTVHRDIDPRDLVESVTDAAMRKRIEPNELGRLSNFVFDRSAANILAKRREETDRYTNARQRTPLREIDPRELVESVHDAAMRKSVEPSDWSRLSNIGFERISTVTPTAFASGPYDCRSPTPFRPLSVGMNDMNLPHEQNRLFSPAPADRPFSPSSENYNSMPRDWRSFRQQYQ